MSSSPAALPTVADVGERALIERIRARAGHAHPWITTGIGDDAAVMTTERGEVVVTTVDALVESVHFRFDCSSAFSIGRKAVAVSLSDLAAMGASARAVLASLMLPSTLPLQEFDGLVDGITTEIAAHGGSLAGGNITGSPGPVAIHVTAIGTAHPRRILTRSGGRAGEELFVTGSIGAAAAGLAAVLEAGSNRGSFPDDIAECVSRYETPSPRLRCGRFVAGYRAASACMDLSDGLADAARQIAAASGTGVLIHADALPIHPGARRWFEAHGSDPIAAALAGGEDYELLFAVPAKRRRAFLAAVHRDGLAAVPVGVLTKERGAKLCRGTDNSELPAGYSHLA